MILTGAAGKTEAALTSEEKGPIRLGFGSPDIDPGFAEHVTRSSHTSPLSCYACRTCSAGCPFYRAMDLGPHGVMRRIQAGLRLEALTSNTIWLCVGCHTCSYVCPMGIDVAAVMDSLRVMALEEDIVPAEPAVLEFHREVLESIRRHGRTHKLEIMLRYKASQKSWFQDVDLGLRMLAKRKLDLRPSNIKDPGDLAKLFDRAWRK